MVLATSRPKAAQRVLAGTHPDVTVLATNKVTIGIDEVRDIITTSEQMPSTAPWRIIIIEDVDRMLERTTNVLLKEIEAERAHDLALVRAKCAGCVADDSLAHSHRQSCRALHAGGGCVSETKWRI